MPWSGFPTRADRIQAEIESAKQAGLGGLARLAALCMWDVSRRLGPRENYPGPEGLKPAQYLDLMLKSQNEAFEAGEPPFRHGSTSVVVSYPKPAKPAQAPRQFTDEEVREMVLRAIEKTMPKDGSTRVQTFLGFVEVVRLWRQGVTTAELKPIIQMMMARLDYWTLMMLIDTGEKKKALGLLEAHPEMERERIGVAHGLIKVGEPDEARALLEERLTGRGLPGLFAGSEKQQAEDASLAKEYAYLGEAKRARSLGKHGYKDTLFDVEAIIALNQLYETGRADSRPLLQQYADIDKDAIAKSIAYEQVEYLEVFLGLEDFDAAWMVLDNLYETLLRVPTFGKFEYRLRDTAGLLEQHVIDHTERTYLFIVNILLATRDNPAERLGLWRMVHAVTGGAWLIFCLSSAEETNNLLEFAEQLPKEIED